MAYNPRPVPLRTEDLARFLTEELQFIARELTQSVQYLLLDTLYAPPKKLIEGMIAKADGTTWNPGSGAGVYSYRAAAWRFLG